jgi:ankyrin repeat protein
MGSRDLYALDQLLRAVPGARGERLAVRELLEREAEALLQAEGAGDPAVAALLHVAAPGRPPGTLSGAEVREVLARFHRLGDWAEALRRGDDLVDPRFEAAADAIVDGDEAALAGLVAADPDLVHARSPFGHRAMLLHHVAANGIEESRQWQSPRNAVAIARILLDAGAEVDATASCYGDPDSDTTMGLLVSSGHPAAAGVQDALVETLLDAGAAIEGPAGDGSPLQTALAFGYTSAAETLARRGARVEDVVAAAGLGRVDVLERVARTSARERVGRALVIAAMHGRVEAVEPLARAGADLAAVADQGMTALHYAAWRGRLDVVDRLIALGAPLEAKNVYGGTVIDMTVWAARNAPFPGVDYPAVVDRLAAAGADLAPVTPPTGDAAIDAVLDRHR